MLRDLVAFLATRPDTVGLEECFARWDLVLAEPGGTTRRWRSRRRWPARWCTGSTRWPCRPLGWPPPCAVAHGRRTPRLLPAGHRPVVAHTPPDIADTRPAPASRRTSFTVSRLDRPKRLDLLIRAMALVPGRLPLLIGGTGPAEAELRALAPATTAFRSSVSWRSTSWPDSTPARGRALPARRRGLGLITLEAMSCGTPVVTCADSGGPTEFVVDGVTGLVVSPTVASLGQALAPSSPIPPARPAWAPRPSAGWPGSAGPPTVAAILGRRRPAPRLRSIDPRCLSSRRPHPLRHTAGRRVVVTTTFPVGNPRHGGQLRCFHLYGALARHVEVDIVSLVDHDSDVGARQLAPGCTRSGVARSGPHRDR